MIFKNELFLSTPFILPETFFLLILSFHTWGNAKVLILNHVILVSVLCVGVGRMGCFLLMPLLLFASTYLDIDSLMNFMYSFM